MSKREIINEASLDASQSFERSPAQNLNSQAQTGKSIHFNSKNFDTKETDFSKSEDWSETDKPNNFKSNSKHDSKTDTTSSSDTEFDHVQAYSDFELMGLKPSLLRGIFGYGFEKPSSIQQRAIVPCLKKKDVIAQAQSGSGKTATFGISVLNNVDLEMKQNQIIILAPTRELAIQHTSVLRCLGEFLMEKGLKIHTSVGGQNTRAEIQQLRTLKPQIIVGTPGRVKHMLSLNEIEGNSISMLVLDEADEMLNKGFTDQVYDIFRDLPGDMQVVLTSATLPTDVLEITERFMRNPVKILVKNENLTLEGIRQFYVNCSDDSNNYRSNKHQEFIWKAQALEYLYESINVTQSVIFVNSRNSANRLGDELKACSFMCSIIHSDLTFDERKVIMQEFKTGSTRVLISTDLLARGIDVQQVNLVVNFELPHEKETYIHRIGRSGRFGRKGSAINLVCQDDMRKVKDLEMYYDTRIIELGEDDVSNYLN